MRTLDTAVDYLKDELAKRGWEEDKCGDCVNGWRVRAQELEKEKLRLEDEADGLASENKRLRKAIEPFIGIPLWCESKKPSAPGPNTMVSVTLKKKRFDALVAALEGK